MLNNNLGLVYWNGEPERLPDPVLAEKYVREACLLNDPEACWLLSTWYMGPQVKFKHRLNEEKLIKEKRIGQLKRDMKKAIEYGNKACEADLMPACINLSRIFRLGDGVPENPEKAAEYADKVKQLKNNLKEGWSPNFTS